MTSTTDISSIFADEKILIQPSTIEYIKSESENPIEFSNFVVTQLDDDVSTVQQEHIDSALIDFNSTGDSQEKSSQDETESTTEEPIQANQDEETEEASETEEKMDEDDSEESHEASQDDQPESVNPNPTTAEESEVIHRETPEEVYESGAEEDVVLEDIGVKKFDLESVDRSGQATVEVTKDIGEGSTGTGDYNDFVSLFNDRYERLKEILTQRVSPVPIKALSDSGGKAVTIIGRVTEARTTQNNNRLVVIEDRTGEFPVVFTDEREQELTEELLDGEVIALEGEVAGNGEILFGNSIMLPEVPPRNKPTKADREVKAAFISDVHLGADTFASDAWNRFVEWIQDKEDIEYLFVAGDVIEGIGVYPGQEEILTVVDMYRQYELCGEAFQEFPDDLEIIICTGNHDMVRLAEPQPPLPEKFTSEFPSNVTFTGNPASIEIENGIHIEFYHGMSINGFTDTIPSADVMNPTTAMKHMLKKRHLAPLYGYNTRIAPEEKDYLVLEEIPDILHSGHVHTFGVDEYNGVTMLNTGSWQYQTDFQEKMNIVPTVANVAVVDLQTHAVEVHDFLD